MNDPNIKVPDCLHTQCNWKPRFASESPKWSDHHRCPEPTSTPPSLEICNSRGADGASDHSSGIPCSCSSRLGQARECKTEAPHSETKTLKTVTGEYELECEALPGTGCCLHVQVTRGHEPRPAYDLRVADGSSLAQHRGLSESDPLASTLGPPGTQ